MKHMERGAIFTQFQASLASPLSKQECQQGQLTRAPPTSKTVNKTMTYSAGC